MGTLNSYIRGALAARQLAAQIEELQGARQQRQLALTQEERAVRLAALQEAASRGQILGQTEAGGQVNVPDLGQIAIPGITRRQELEAAGAKSRSKATTAGQLEAQTEAFDALNKKAILDAKSKLEAAGIKPEDEGYNRQLARMLGVQEEIPISIGGQTYHLPAKDAVGLLEKREERTQKLADAKSLADYRAQLQKDRDAIQNAAALNRAKVLAGAKPANAAELRAANFYLRGADAESELLELEGHISGLSVAGQIRQAHAPNLLQTPEGKLYLQAKRQFVEAYLRKDSGAQISPTEFDKADATYFIQAGDTQEVIDRKRKARKQLLDAMRKESGRALEPAPQTRGIEDILDVDAEGNVVP